MCEILFDNRTDREDTQGMHWRRGMAITVQADGHKWSKAELAPHRLILKMPGVPKSSPVAMRYFEPVEGRRRKYTLNLKTLSKEDIDFLGVGNAKSDKELADKMKTREVELTATGVKSLEA